MNFGTNSPRMIFLECAKGLICVQNRDANSYTFHIESSALSSRKLMQKILKLGKIYFEKDLQNFFIVMHLKSFLSEKNIPTFMMWLALTVFSTLLQLEKKFGKYYCKICPLC